MNSIPQESPLPSAESSTSDKVTASLIQIGGVPFLMLSRLGETVAILTVEEAECFAVRLLDLTLSTKPDGDPCAIIARRHLSADPIPDSMPSCEERSPC